MIVNLAGHGATLSWLTLSPRKGRGGLQCASNMLPEECSMLDDLYWFCCIQLLFSLEVQLTNLQNDLAGKCC